MDSIKSTETQRERERERERIINGELIRRAINLCESVCERSLLENATRVIFPGLCTASRSSESTWRRNLSFPAPEFRACTLKLRSKFKLSVYNPPWSSDLNRAGGRRVPRLAAPLAPENTSARPPTDFDLQTCVAWTRLSTSETSTRMSREIAKSQGDRVWNASSQTNVQSRELLGIESEKRKDSLSRLFKEEKKRKKETRTKGGKVWCASVRIARSRF